MTMPKYPDEDIALLLEQAKNESERKKLKARAFKLRYRKLVLPILQTTGVGLDEDIEDFLKEVDRQIDTGLEWDLLPFVEEAETSRKYVDTLQKSAIKRELAREKERQTAVQQQETGNASWLNRMRGFGGQAPQQTLQQTPDMWEQLRQQAMGQLTSPRSWIDRWMIEHMPVPQQAKIQPYQKVEIEQAFMSRLQEAKAWTDAHPPAIPGSDYWNEVQGLNDQIAAHQTAVDEAQRGLNEALSSQAAQVPTEESEAAWRAGIPRRVPATPSWMESLVPGMTGGIEKGRQVPTPSMQQWETLNPSQQQQFAGYLDWAGINFEDVMANMQRGRPRTPQGAGFSRWSPISQGR